MVTRLASFPRGNAYDRRGLLQRKGELAAELTAVEGADWLKLTAWKAGAAPQSGFRHRSELRVAAPGEELDTSRPRRRHFIDGTRVNE